VIRATDLDPTLQRAFGLAFFLHGDREVALRIVAEAMEKLEVAASAQHKRLYYRSAGRSRVSLSEPHLLQRLVFIESEPFERRKEQAAGSPIGREDLLVHYLKHLIRITLKRNSFYVTLGISRLLFTYTTSETMQIYQAVIQDPERVKSDYYYRSRKATLLHELKERFGDLLRVSRAAHGEERFQEDEDPEGLAGLVEEGLRVLTPWNTPCTMPARWNPFTEGIPSLTSTALKAEDDVEIHRIHTTLHPDCFRKLIAALGLDTPDSRLRIPRFFASGGTGHGGNRRNPPVLGEEDLQRIKDHLAERTERRRRTSCELLRVLVDGEERARLDAREVCQVRFEVGRGAELIEVRARDEQGEIPLAAHLLGPAKASIALEDGREITFVVTLSRDADGEVEGGLVEVRHRPAEARNALSRFFEWLVPATDWWAAPALVPALAVLLLVLCAVGVVLLIRWREPAGIPATSTAGARPVRPPAARPPERDQRPVVPLPEEIAARTPSGSGRGALPHETGGDDGDVLRSLPGAAGVASLGEVSKVCVDATGDETSGRDVARGLATRLGEGGRLRVTEDAEEADACLKLAVERLEEGRLKAVVRLVNADGRVLWPSSGPAGRTYEGSAEEVAAGIAGDLLAGS